MKQRFFKKYGILLLVCIMVITTTVSFVFWATGILGDNDSEGGDIHIGKGRDATTSVSLSDSTISEGSLVPLTVTPISGETHTISIEFTVKWIAFDDPAEVVDGAEGKLTVACISILAGQVDLTNEMVDGDAPLFIINFGGDEGVYDISGNADESGLNVAVVTITIQLNEPKDEEQYLKIAGETIFLTFSFVVADIDYLTERPL